MPTSGGGTPPDPGGHTAVAKDNPRFVPPSWYPPCKVKEPLDAIRDYLFPVPVLTASHHDPDFATILQLHMLELWPGYAMSVEETQLSLNEILPTDAVLDLT